MASLRSTTSPSPRRDGRSLRLHFLKSYLIHDPEFLSTPAWKEQNPPAETISKTDARYRVWKKQVPALQGDAIQLGTGAGIDIPLYWNGKQWRLFWPNEEP